MPQQLAAQGQFQLLTPAGASAFLACSSALATAMAHSVLFPPANGRKAKLIAPLRPGLQQ